MELMVAVAIVLILGVIALPVYQTIRARANLAVALSKLQQMGTACARYTGEHNDTLPREDITGKDNWQSVVKPENSDVWYNALPPLLGHQSVAAYGSNLRRYYDKGNILFLPGATYPSDDRKLAEPIFAYAMNSRLQKKTEDGSKPPGHTSGIQRPSRTVLFFERGIKGEKKALPAQPGYDGRPKGNGRAFVARYNGKGVLVFVDGHAETAQASDLMDEGARLHFPPTDIVWSRSPDDDPNS